MESARVRSQAGFTLIEIGLVLLIIGAMLTIAIPRFGDRSYARLESQARKMAITIRYLRHAAILNGRTYRLIIDLDTQEYFTAVGSMEDQEPADESEDEELFESLTGGEEESAQTFQRDWDGPISLTRMRNGLQFSDVNLPLTSGRQFDGPVWVHFYPDGYVDICVIHIDNGEDVYTVYVDNPIMGRVNVAPGYLEW